MLYIYMLYLVYIYMIYSFTCPGNFHSLEADVPSVEAPARRSNCELLCSKRRNTRVSACQVPILHRQRRHLEQRRTFAEKHPGTVCWGLKILGLGKPNLSQFGNVLKSFQDLCYNYANSPAVSLIIKYKQNYYYSTKVIVVVGFRFAFWMWPMHWVVVGEPTWFPACSRWH